MHQISVIGSTNEVLKSISLPESVKLEIENETITFSSGSEEAIDSVKDSISGIIANVIKHKYTRQMLDDVLKFSEYDFTDEDKEILFSDISKKDLFDGVGFIREKLSDFLSGTDSLSVEGFVKFRLWDYREAVKKAVEHYIERVNAVREYDELIDLLRMYIDTLPCIERKINLHISASGGYTLFSGKWEDITEKCIKDISVGEELKEMSFDEILLSSIISAAPKEIVIHNHRFCRNEELINTIKKIFDKRVKECKGCRLCR